MKVDLLRQPFRTLQRTQVGILGLKVEDQALGLSTACAAWQGCTGLEGTGLH